MENLSEKELKSFLALAKGKILGQSLTKDDMNVIANCTHAFNLKSTMDFLTMSEENQTKHLIETFQGIDNLENIVKEGGDDDKEFFNACLHKNRLYAMEKVLSQVPNGVLIDFIRNEVKKFPNNHPIEHELVNKLSHYDGDIVPFPLSHFTRYKDRFWNKSPIITGLVNELDVCENYSNMCRLQINKINDMDYDDEKRRGIDIFSLQSVFDDHVYGISKIREVLVKFVIACYFV